MNIDPQSVYLFVDGEHLQQVWNETICRVANQDVPIDFTKLLKAAHASKGFYYDCIPGEAKKGESATEFDKRRQEREEYFEYIRGFPGFHVRPGITRGRGGKQPQRQKEVDVLLTVEMLTHAFRGNARGIVCITSDLDFRPLIEAVVQTGAYVRLMSGANAPRELRWSADVWGELHPQFLVELVTDECRGLLPSVWRHRPRDAPKGATIVRQGQDATGRFTVCETPSARPNPYSVFYENVETGELASCQHKDWDTVNRWLEVIGVQVTWNEG